MAIKEFQDIDRLNAFCRIFQGAKTSFGIHEYGSGESKVTDAGEKQGGTNKAVSQSLSKHFYIAHLTGSVWTPDAKKFEERTWGIGVVPVTEAGKVTYTMIDIDLFNVPEKLKVYVKAIYENNLPLVPIRSKSGGLHLYTFYGDGTSDFEGVDAVDALNAAKALVRLLALDKLVKNVKGNLSAQIEIFPKQSRKKVSSNSKATGNWHNLPYYNADNNPPSYAYDANMEPLSLAEFIDHMSTRMYKSPADVMQRLNDLPYADAPPCLQTLYLLDYIKQEGDHRNDYLFNFSLYLKAKDAQNFEQEVIDINQSLDSPVADGEVESITQSVKKNVYNYKCTQEPICAFCNKETCKLREFGVNFNGKNKAIFTDIEFGEMRQLRYINDNPVYEWNVRLQGGEWNKFTFPDEKSILDQTAFTIFCMREMHRAYVPLKRERWFEVVEAVLRNMVVVKQSIILEDTDMLSYLFGVYLGDRTRGDATSVKLNGTVYLESKTGSYYFSQNGFLLWAKERYNQTFSIRDITLFCERRDIKTGVLATGKGYSRVNIKCRVMTSTQYATHLYSGDSIPQRQAITYDSDEIEDAEVVEMSEEEKERSDAEQLKLLLGTSDFEEALADMEV